MGGFFGKEVAGVSVFRIVVSGIRGSSSNFRPLVHHSGRRSASDGVPMRR